MPTISQEEKNKSIAFCSLMTEMMELIDDLSKDIPEGRYLELCDKIKNLHNRATTNEIIVEHTRRSNMRVRARPRVLTDAEKLATGRWQVCEFCDKIISKKWYNNHINETEYCKIARESKQLALTTKQHNNAAKTECIAKIKAALHKRR